MVIAPRLGVMVCNAASSSANSLDFAICHTPNSLPTLLGGFDLLVLSGLVEVVTA